MYQMYSHEFAQRYLNPPEALRYLSNISDGRLIARIERTEKRGCKFNSLRAYITEAFNLTRTPEECKYWRNIINRLDSI